MLLCRITIFYADAVRRSVNRPAIYETCQTDCVIYPNGIKSFFFWAITARLFKIVFKRGIKRTARTDAGNISGIDLFERLSLDKLLN